MRNYICTHRRKGTHMTRALTAWKAAEQAAEVFGRPAIEVLVELWDVTPPGYRAD